MKITSILYPRKDETTNSEFDVIEQNYYHAIFSKNNAHFKIVKCHKENDTFVEDFQWMPVQLNTDKQTYLLI